MRKAIFGGALIALMTAGAASAADYVILDSTAAGIEPGIVVDGGAELTVPTGAQVVLIDPAGETLMVEGPFSGPVSAAAEAAEDGSAIERLTTSRGTDTSVLGAVRSLKIQGGSVSE